MAVVKFLFCFAFCLISTFCTVSAQSKCVSCASAYFQDNWGITGLQKPNVMTFGEACMKADGSQPEVSTEPGYIAQVSCDGMCTDILLTYTNANETREYGVVRGCYKDMTSSVSKTPFCYVGFTNGYYAEVKWPESTQPFPDYTAIITYNNVSNTMFQVTTGLSSKFGEMFKDLGCTNTSESTTPQLACKSCNEAVGDKCGPKVDTTCSGAYCTKLEYPSSGKTIVKRGCAPVNFYVEELCTPVTVTQQHVSPGNLAVRTRRDVSRIQETGTYCICSTDSCNSASGVGFSFLLFTAIAYCLL